MRFDKLNSAITYIFRSRRKLDHAPRELDEHTRDTSSTKRLLQEAGLSSPNYDLTVITGSRGKGSTTAILAKCLQSLGHKVGMITSPHLIHWNERIRVNGHMIPTTDFLRILSCLSPIIDDIDTNLDERQYLSPQGIFLAIALQWFNGQEIDCAILEVGRGGRFDDIAVVPNRVSLFTPIIKEHTNLLGDTLSRIAWHKAGIIKRNGVAFTVPQSSDTMSILQAEADEKNAILYQIKQTDLAQHKNDTPDGLHIQLPNYGEINLSMLGYYQLPNVTLAVHACQNIHTHLTSQPITHTDRERITSALGQVQWLGRTQKLQDNPQVFIDGAIHIESAQAFVDSIRSRLTKPVVTIVGIPRDRDLEGVYGILASVSDYLILTENHANPNTHFPDPAVATQIARLFIQHVQATDNLPSALDIAKPLAGTDGTILIVGSLMLMGECMLSWQIPSEMI